MHRTKGSSLAALLSCLLIAGCGDDTGPSDPGNLSARAATAGSDFDPDGYVVNVDAGARLEPVAVDGSVTFEGLSAGNHSVALEQVASNCAVSGDNPRTISVASGGTAATTFVVTCEAITGDVRVTTATVGDEIDGDGYSLRVDGVVGPAIGTEETVTLTQLTSGLHTIELVDVADNCLVSGDNPRTLTVPAGGQADTTFDVVCSGTTGSLATTTSTTGSDLDLDGYTISIDGSVEQGIGPDATVTISGLSVGNHSVELGDVAGNCSVGGDNPRVVVVAAGATVSTTFNVSCAEQVGNLEVTTVTWGLNTDNSYTVNVDGAAQGSIGANAVDLLTAVPAGGRQVSLTGIKSNCAVQGSNPRSVSVPEGQTSQTTFDVFCFETLSNQIVFESRRNGDSELYVMNNDGSGQLNLTRHPDQDKEPDVAADGSAVVFDSDRDAGNRDVWIMEDGGFRNLTDSGAQERSPSFSGLGDRVSYTRKSSTSTWSIWTVSRAGGGATALTDDSGDDEQPAWSADGSMILFRSDRDGQGHYDIYVMDSNGQNITRLTTDAGEDGKPAWSSTGTQITWSTNRLGSFDVWRADFDSATRTISGLVNLTPGSPGVDGKSDWRPGQARVAYSSDNDGDSEIYVMNADGSGQQQITNNSGDDLEPSWSP